jgi:multisite-specific tRNA:(cytosine-C5)-methyltransferase
MRFDARPTADLSAFAAYYRAQNLLPPAELPLLLDALQTPLPLDVRASQRAALADRALARLSSLQDDEGHALRWAETARQWPSAAPAAKPFLHQQQLRGALHRQESASMLPALLLDPEPHHAVLDLCAAPGSKSIQLLALMEEDAPPSPSPPAAPSPPPPGLLVANVHMRGSTPPDIG